MTDEDIRRTVWKCDVLIASCSPAQNEGLWVFVEEVEIPKTFESVFNVFYRS